MKHSRLGKRVEYPFPSQSSGDFQVSHWRLSPILDTQTQSDSIPSNHYTLELFLRYLVQKPCLSVNDRWLIRPEHK